MEKESTIGDLVKQTKITNRLLAAQLKGTMKQQELIMLLASTEATAKEIAEILDTTAGTVSNAIARGKKHIGQKEKENHGSKK